jgi:hypothetical protein
MQILLAVNVIAMVAILCLLNGSGALKFCIQFTLLMLVGTNVFFFLKTTGYIFQLS